jgi:hypothetical protein
MGQLAVTANVGGAKISVDSSHEPDWVTPHTFALPAGTHQVVISKEGYDDYSRSVTIEGGQSRSLEANLSVPTGEVYAATPPGWDVYIDGKLIGAGPVDKIVPVGKHTFMVKGPNGASAEKAFEVKSGGTSILKVPLPQGGTEAATTGIIEVRTIPRGATVTWDGNPVPGTTPISFRLPPGHHVLVISLYPYRPVQEAIDVTANQTVQRDIQLRR